MTPTGRILLLLPELPWPSVTGGKRAHLITLNRLRENGYDVHIVAANIDSPEDVVNEVNNGIYGPNIKIVPTASPKLQKSQLGRWGAFLSGVLSLYPSQYAYAHRSSGRDVVAKQLEVESYDCIWVDHLCALAFLPKSPGIRVVLSTQNVETDLLSASVKQAKRLSQWLKRLLDYLRMRFFEGRLLRRADRLVCLSIADARIIESRHSLRTHAVLLPISTKIESRWRPPTMPVLTFAGNYSFAPNQDAIDWLVDALAPCLHQAAPLARIRIIGGGNYPDKFRNAPNIEFLGQLPDAQFAVALQTSTAIISPVVIGSGIKMKVVDAMCLGIPIIATRESLEGLSGFSPLFLIDRNKSKTIRNCNGIISAISNKLQIEKSLISAEEFLLNSSRDINNILNEQIYGDF